MEKIKKSVYEGLKGGIVIQMSVNCHRVIGKIFTISLFPLSIFAGLIFDARNYETIFLFIFFIMDLVCRQRLCPTTKVRSEGSGYGFPDPSDRTVCNRTYF